MLYTSYHIRPIRQLPDNTRIFAGLLAIQNRERIRLERTSHWREFCRISLYRFPGRTNGKENRWKLSLPPAEPKMEIKMDLDFRRGNGNNLEDHENSFTVKFEPYKIIFARKSNYIDQEINQVESAIKQILDKFPKVNSIFCTK